MATDLKLNSIAAERAALASVHEVATEEQRNTLGLFHEERDDCLVSVCAAERGIMLNRSVGLGAFQPAGEELVDWVIGRFTEREVSRAFVALSEGCRPGTLPDSLRARGLEEARAWAKFCREPGSAPGGRTDLRVAPLQAADSGHWGSIVAAAFDMPESTGPLLARLIEHPGWRLFMTWAGDEPAGGAGMFVHEGVAWFDWAATDPAFRRRGSQGALMRARIGAATELGCTHLMTATGEAVAGDPQHSWGNIGRYGFRKIFRSRNFVV